MPTRYGLGRSRSAHLLAQKSAYSGRSSRASTSCSRFVGRSVGQKRAGLVGGGQAADHVEIRAAEKRGVAGRLARQDAEPLELVPHVAVDEVRPRQGGVRRGVARAVERNGRVPGGDLVHVADHQARLARQRAGRDQARRTLDRDDAGFVRLKVGQPRHVANRAVAVMGQHAQLLAGAGGQHVLGRFDRDPLPASARRGDAAFPRQSSAAAWRIPGYRAAAAARRRGASPASACAAAGCCSGEAGNTRRPWASSTMAAKSKSGSKPSSES